MWPTPQEFNEAIQDPYLCFEDEQLKASSVSLNPLGLPRSITGAFASVYQLKNKNTAFAVRCFLEERNTLIDRYRIIEDYLKKLDIEPLIDFQFLERGIKVRGSWYPVLKMDWCSGVPLDQYLAKNVKNAGKVKELRERFHKIACLMHEKEIAHGDLQHGNILATKDNLYLVDYDGMFVPRFSQSESVELGHRNFQHPKRSNGDFSSRTDNFSCWLIHSSLEILAIDSSLWERLECGDDSLLFKFNDLLHPEASNVFRELSNHESEDIRRLAATISKLLRFKPDCVPPLTVSQEEIDQLSQDSDLLLGEQDQISTSDRIAIVLSDNPSPSNKRSSNKLVPALPISRKFASKLFKLKEQSKMHFASMVAPQYWAETCLSEGVHAYNSGNYGEAIKKFKQLTQIFGTKRDGHNWLFEANLNLGYCYVKTNQLGTAAHYFREAERSASFFNRSDSSMHAILLLAATYYETGQKNRSYELITKSIQPVKSIEAVIREEREGAFYDSLTIPELLLNVGHIYLEIENLQASVYFFEACIEFCQWIENDRNASQIKDLVRRALTGYCLAKFEDNPEEMISLFRKNFKSSSSLAKLLETEKDSKISTQFRYAEFLRLVAHSYYEDERFKNSKAAYGQALKVYRKLSFEQDSNIYVADCLLGMGNTPDAVKILINAFEEEKEIEIDLIAKLESVYEYHYATIISALILMNGTYKHRNKCLNYLTSIAPSGDKLSLSLRYLNNSRLNKSKNLAILLADCAKDLTHLGRNIDAQEIYSTSFKIFQRAGLVDSDAERVIECLLSNDDLDTAASLLMDSTNFEQTVRAIVSATVKGNNFQLNVICEILEKVLEKQMGLPYEHVSDEELKVTLSLLKWCATDDDIRVIVMEEKCEIWQKRREITLAHNLIDQGKFGTAIGIFEKIEGPSGPNVIQSYELWSMRYFTIALENRSQSRLQLVDGYALGCAIEIISTLKDKNGLTRDFAERVSELISRSNPFGMEQHLGVLLEIYNSMGADFDKAKNVIFACLNEGVKPVEMQSDNYIESRPAHKPFFFDGSEAFDSSSTETGFKDADDFTPSRYTSSLKETSLNSKSRVDERLWKALHRALFLVDRERYSEAVKALTEFESLDQANRFTVDANIALGYCHYLLSNSRLAKSHFFKAVEESKSDRVESYYRASICLTQFVLGLDLTKNQIRTLIDPSSQKKDIYKVAARIVNRTIELESDLALTMADQLYGEGEEHEGLQHISPAEDKYEAALAIYGITNTERASEVIDCLDAVKKYDLAANRLKEASLNKRIDIEEFQTIVLKLARRHVKTRDLAKIIEIYARSDIGLSKYVIEVERDLIFQKLTRILTSAIPPERYISQLIKDIDHLRHQNKLDRTFVDKLAKFIDANLENCSLERIERLSEGLEKLAGAIETISESSAELITFAIVISRDKKKKEKA